MKHRSDLGLIGLAVMGQNLVLNLARNGYTISVYNRTAQRTQDFMADAAQGKTIRATYSLTELVDSLSRPRKLLLMVQAGSPVDATLSQLTSLLDEGDVVMDGGNSYYLDTQRRAGELAQYGILYLGVGVSGGEEGALNGPSIMPGGSREAYDEVEDMLTAIAAKAKDGEPCCAYVGEGGAGHYVKMTHNGIEYGDMQLICEAYDLLTHVAGLTPAECAQVFAEWNRGELDSYLIEITAEILATVDPDTGRPLVDVILDSAGQKGTGKLTSQQALELGVPIPTVAEAVFARYLSALKPQRVEASRVLRGPDAMPATGERAALIADVGKALYISKICSYAQGFALMQTASEQFDWGLNLGAIAMLWRGGCIIRASFLSDIARAFRARPDLPNLLVDGHFSAMISEAQYALRRVVALAAQCGVSAPSFMSALAYYDGYRAERLPHNLLQAQRDFFGAHTYQRIDREGVFHTEWRKGHE